MAEYDYIIFDADHTVIDFDADERRAFRAAFRAAGIQPTADMVEACWKFSAQNWGDLGLYNVHLPEIRARYHELYYIHVRDIMQFADAAYGLGAGRAEAERTFSEALAEAAHPVEDAPAVLQELSARYKLCVATNGLTFMQTGRLAALRPLFYRTFISEEMGCIKPDPAFFRAMTEQLRAPVSRCLMVGDSLGSDIAGANAAGMDCIWFDRRGERLPPAYRVKAVITHLNELLEIL